MRMTFRLLAEHRTQTGRHGGGAVRNHGVSPMMHSKTKGHTHMAKRAFSGLIVLTVLAGAVACTGPPKEVLGEVNGSSKEFLIGAEDLRDGWGGPQQARSL